MSEKKQPRNKSQVKQLKQVTVDGSFAVAHIAYRVSEICSIYPITPSSDMAEMCDEWSAAGLKNI